MRAAYALGVALADSSSLRVYQHAAYGGIGWGQQACLGRLGQGLLHEGGVCGVGRRSIEGTTYSAQAGATKTDAIAYCWR
jgi:hypothetical protein